RRRRCLPAATPALPSPGATGVGRAGGHRGRAAGGGVDLVRSVRGGVLRTSAPGAAAGGQGSTGACLRGGQTSADERLLGPARGWAPAGRRARRSPTKAW